MNIKHNSKSNLRWLLPAFAFLLVGSFGIYQIYQIPRTKIAQKAVKQSEINGSQTNEAPTPTITEENTVENFQAKNELSAEEAHALQKKAYRDFLFAHPYHQPPKYTREQIKGMPKGDRPHMARRQDFLITIDPNTRTLPRERLEVARTYTKERLKRQDKAGIPNVTWTERGPNNVGGRTRAFMFDPNDATNRKAWAGGVTGGLWYNTNITSAATAWTRVDDFWSNIAISCIVADPSTPQTFYVGTGESSEAFDSATNPSSFLIGDGIWKTTDGGTTWNQLAATRASSAGGNNFTFVSKMVVNSAGHIFAATRGRADNQGGIMRSTDGGVTWTRVLAPSSNVGVSLAGANNSMSDIEIGSNGDLYAGNFSCRIFRSTNGGNTWANITPPGVGGTNGQNNRVEMALAPSTTNTTAGTTIYALGVSYPNVSWFRKSTDGGTSWSSLNIPKMVEQNCVQGTRDFANGQAWYDLIVSVKPDNANTVLIGGLDVHGSTDGGTTFSMLSYWTGGCATYVHADIHNIVFRPGNFNEVVVASDGGLSYSPDAGTLGTSFSDRNNGYNVTQFYACATPATSGSNRFFAGAQDNGTIMTSAVGAGAGTTVGGGDGAFCFVDQTNANIVINSYIQNVYRRSTNGGTTQNSYNTIVNDQNSGLFINPADYDNTANVLYSAGDPGAYKRIINMEATPSSQQTVAGSGLSGQPSAFRANAYTANRIFVGTTTGDLFRIDNANTDAAAAVSIGAGLPAGYVTSIDLGASDNEIIVTLGNFGIQSVYYSTNGGTSWTSKDMVGQGLPDVPVRWALFNPNDYKQVMLATELGVWSTTDITSLNPAWEPSNTGLANVRCDMLKYRASDKMVVVATHGRGLFTTNAFANPAIAVSQYLPANNATMVGASSNLQLTFTGNVLKGAAGNITIKRLSDNSIFETIAVTSAQVTIAGAVVTIDPTNNLAETTAYYVEVAAGAFKGSNNVNFPGFTGNSTWRFTSSETTAPTAINFSPANNATSVAVDGNLTVTFSENVQKGTGDILIKKTSDNSVLQTIAVSSASVTITNATVTINPSADLNPSTQYYVEIPNGAIKDLANNNFAGFTGAGTWQFTTGADMTPPIVVSFVPTNNNNSVPGANDLSITFSENVKKGAAGKQLIISRLNDGGTIEAIDVTSSNVTIAGNVVTINPTNNLPFLTEVYVEIDNGAFLDLTDNAYTGIFGSTTWKFKTDVSTPIEDTQIGKNIKIYPNPIQKQATLEVTQGLSFGQASLIVFDSKGVKVWEQKVERLTEKQDLALGNLPAGQYLLEIQTKQGKTTKQIIKQ